MESRIEKAVYGALGLLLAAAWLKLAYDLVFNFGPASARAWFPAYAVVFMSAFSILLLCLNACAIHRLIRFPSQPQFGTPGRLLVITAFLASLFSCWDTRTVMKAIDMYLIIPAVILLIAAAPKGRLPFAFRLPLLLLAFLLLFPNDKCENPQNWWWVCRVGASPLTYVLPVNVLLFLMIGSWRRSMFYLIPAVTALYYIGCVYHGLVHGY